MLASVEHVVVELTVVNVREREGYLALCLHVELHICALEGKVAQSLMVAHYLRCALLLKHSGYGCGVTAEQ